MTKTVFSRNLQFAFFLGQTRVREQQNLITPYLDAGTVYGSSNFQLQQLLVPRSSKRDIMRTGVMLNSTNRLYLKTESSKLCLFRPGI